MRLHQHSLSVVHMLTSVSLVVQYTATETLCLVVLCLFWVFFKILFCFFAGALLAMPFYLLI